MPISTLRQHEDDSQQYPHPQSILYAALTHFDLDSLLLILTNAETYRSKKDANLMRNTNISCLSIFNNSFIPMVIMHKCSLLLRYDVGTYIFISFPHTHFAKISFK